MLFECVVDDHLVKSRLCLFVEREQHHAGGVAVQAVERLHVSRGKAVAHRQQQVAGESVSVRSPVPSPWTIMPAGLSMAMSQASQ